jgi:hypothetical protein
MEHKHRLFGAANLRNLGKKVSCVRKSDVHPRVTVEPGLGTCRRRELVVVAATACLVRESWLQRLVFSGL